MDPKPLFETAEWAAFLARIRENPEDRTPRLVAADWLQERGAEDLANYIRGQCTGERVPISAGRFYNWFSDELIHPVSISHALGATRVRERSGPGSGGGQLVPSTAFRIEAGFLEEVRCSWYNWSHVGRRLVRHPLACVRSVSVTDSHPILTRFEGYAHGWSAYSGSGTYSVGRLYYAGLMGFVREQTAVPAGIKLKLYPTITAARAALSDVLIRHAWSEPEEGATT